jgi:hypothetical protein
MDVLEQAVISAGAPYQSGRALSLVQEASLNDQRLAKALSDAIGARDKIAGEQAKYDLLIEAAEAKRQSLIAINAPPNEVEQTETEILEHRYYQWLVAQKLSRAADEAERRLDYLRTLDTPEKQQAEMAYCRSGIEGRLHWWHHWAWTSDPRTDAPLTYIPFLPFDCQDDLIHWIYDLIYVRHKDGHLDKSRDLGASWIVVLFGAMEWLLAESDQPFLATYGSRKEEFVDKVGDADTLLEKARIAIKLVPGWQLPKGFQIARHATFLRIVNPATGSLLKGESANDNFARGGRQAMVVFDEAAAWPSGGYAAWTSASESTRTRLAVSTPQGKFNKFGELVDDKNIPRYSLHWRKHPWKTEEAYQIASRRLSAVELAQEWDLDYEGSVAGRLLWMWSEPHHVITWSEFSGYFGKNAFTDTGQPRIPKGWKIVVAHDCGTTDDHPSVIIAAAMSPANSPLPRHLFFFEQIFMGEGAHPLILAPIIKDKFKLYWSDIETWEISHEANAERMIYRDTFGLPFEAWNTEQGYTQGYPQTQAFFTPYHGRHPFRPQLEGHPRAFVIVDDRQGGLVEKPQDAGVINLIPGVEFTNLQRRESIQKILTTTKSRYECAPPINNEGGFKRWREEAPRIHIPQSEAGKPAKAQRHFKKFDDAFDVIRAICAGVPTMVGLTEEEKLQQRLTKDYKPENLQATLQDYTAVYAYQDQVYEITKDLKREGGSAREGRTGEPIKTMRDRR